MDKHLLYECGICDGLHPWDWDDDCRDNANRYADIEDYIERTANASYYNVEVRSWDDRLEADDAEAQYDSSEA